MSQYRKAVEQFIRELGYQTYDRCLRLYDGRALDSFVVCNKGESIEKLEYPVAHDCPKAARNRDDILAEEELIPENNLVFYFETEEPKVYVWFRKRGYKNGSFLGVENETIDLRDPQSFERIEELILNCCGENVRSN